jgi:microsomal epoxide hydrolase
MADRAIPSFLKPTLPITPFTVAVPDDDIDEFKTLLRLSKLPPATSTSDDRELGVTAAWMRSAKAKWETDFDWCTLSSPRLWRI